MKPQKILVYARVSTADKTQKPEAQIHQLHEYCHARNWVINCEIIDKGFSGSTDTRPGFVQLMKLARTRKVDVILVTKIDRLFRSLKHLVTSLDEFQSLGITFVSINDHFDYSTPNGKLLAAILGSLAEFEKSLLIERTKAGLNFARSRGKILGRPKKRNDIQILSLRDSGLSYSQIAQKLTVSRGAVYRALKASSKTYPKEDHKKQTFQY